MAVFAVIDSRCRDVLFGGWDIGSAMGSATATRSSRDGPADRETGEAPIKAGRRLRSSMQDPTVLVFDTGRRQSASRIDVDVVVTRLPKDGQNDDQKERVAANSRLVCRFVSRCSFSFLYVYVSGSRVCLRVLREFRARRVVGGAIARAADAGLQKHKTIQRLWLMALVIW